MKTLMNFLNEEANFSLRTGNDFFKFMNKVEKYINELAPLQNNEMVDLAIMKTSRLYHIYLKNYIIGQWKS